MFHFSHDLNDDALIDKKNGSEKKIHPKKTFMFRFLLFSLIQSYQ